MDDLRRISVFHLGLHADWPLGSTNQVAGGMIFLRQLGWIDYEALAATLAARSRRSLLKGENGVRVAVVDGRYPDWSALKNMIGRAGRILAEQAPDLELVETQIEMLEAGAVVPWAKGKPEIVVHVGLVTNPMCLLLVGNQGLSVQPGMVVVTHGVNEWHSAINAGSSPRLHLVLKLKRREVEE